MRIFLKCFIIYVTVISTSIVSHEAHAQDSQLTSAQTFLIEQGYELGKADGFMGPRTKVALESFQQENNLDVTGDIDLNTLAEIQKIIQTSTRPEVDKVVKGEGVPDTSSSPLLWLLLGGLVC